MGDNTAIEWADASWSNVLVGCSRLSDGCRNCYAESIANRFKGEGLPYEGLIASTGQWNGTVRFNEDALNQPLRWRRPRRIFVCSMSDVFHESVSVDDIAKIFAVMYLANWHTFQVLTKRAERMKTILNDPLFYGRVLMAAETLRAANKNLSAVPIPDPSQFPSTHIWLGVSVENQSAAEVRIPLLMETPAAVRWISAEPLLGPINLNNHKLDWVVVGGESGSKSRPMHPDWARLLRDQCVEQNIPFFFKQWGEYGSRAFHMSTGEMVFREFDTYGTWVAKARSWVNDGICLDKNGKQLHNGGDFMKARDNGDFPVVIMHKMGKKNSGNKLDGKMWEMFPAGIQHNELARTK